MFLKTQSGDMYVKGVRPGGSAARSGTVSRGDRLYSIDETLAEGQAPEVLRGLIQVDSFCVSVEDRPTASARGSI